MATNGARIIKIVAYLSAGMICCLAAFVCSGIYNIGADDHHTKIVTAIIKQVRDRSISIRTRDIEVPNLEDPSRIVAGADRYGRLCAGCHLAPGELKSDLSPGLYPHPPNLAMSVELDPPRLFWTIKHGIKMSAMPAWGHALSDEEIWDLVAFARKMPRMSAESYRQLSKSR
jgi:mono/diheme cytochrome c family protein